MKKDEEDWRRKNKKEQERTRTKKKEQERTKKNKNKEDEEEITRKNTTEATNIFSPVQLEISIEIYN
jgi:hypothetical protein